ncbi:MAG: hypothetical protein V3W19_16295 [Desulfatiglandales bacterium]
MIEFTKEEIILSKQIAEKYKKEIECGDWILRNGKLILNLDGKLAWSDDAKQDIIITITTKIETIPLWTISDCLEFLRKKAWFIIYAYDAMGSTFSIEIGTTGGHYPGGIEAKKEFSGKGLLEACLKAVLEEVCNG